MKSPHRKTDVGFFIKTKKEVIETYQALIKFIEGYVAASPEDQTTIREFFQRAGAKGLSFETAFAMAVLNRAALLKIVEENA